MFDFSSDEVLVHERVPVLRQKAKFRFLRSRVAIVEDHTASAKEAAE